MTQMRAIVLDVPGPPESLQLRTIPKPVPRDGWVLLRVEAFGMNRSELHTRLGLAGDDVSFPRVLGIEAAGVIEAAPGTGFELGTRAVAMMGGMGRTFDGGYAEYTLVPAACVIPVDTKLDWRLLGALPEILQTAWGSISVGVNLSAGDALLVRGGTSSVGLMSAILAKRRGAIVFSTTRRADRAQALLDIGVDHVLVDDGQVAEKVGGYSSRRRGWRNRTCRRSDTKRYVKVLPTWRHHLFYWHVVKSMDCSRVLSHRFHSDRCQAHGLWW